MMMDENRKIRWCHMARQAWVWDVLMAMGENKNSGQGYEHNGHRCHRSARGRNFDWVKW
jgi:hypothetical protein